jgi:hypothetical protein
MAPRRNPKGIRHPSRVAHHSSARRGPRYWCDLSRHRCPPRPCASARAVHSAFYRRLPPAGRWVRCTRNHAVAMEAMGSYWIPVLVILGARGIEVLLVNAWHVKNVPGRQTDVNDAQWPQQRHQYGLLWGRCRPAQAWAALRAYPWQREGLLEYAAAHIQQVWHGHDHMAHGAAFHLVAHLSGREQGVGREGGQRHNPPRRQNSAPGSGQRGPPADGAGGLLPPVGRLPWQSHSGYCHGTEACRALLQRHQVWHGL